MTPQDDAPLPLAVVDAYRADAEQRGRMRSTRVLAGGCQRAAPWACRGFKARARLGKSRIQVVCVIYFATLFRNIFTTSLTRRKKKIKMALRVKWGLTHDTADTDQSDLVSWVPLFKLPEKGRLSIHLSPCYACERRAACATVCGCPRGVRSLYTANRPPPYRRIPHRLHETRDCTCRRRGERIPRRLRRRTAHTDRPGPLTTPVRGTDGV